MDWVLALEDSKLNADNRTTASGDTMVRHEDGNACLIPRDVSRKVLTLREDRVNGYHDWEPL